VGELESVFGAGITRDTEEADQRIRALVSRITVMPDGYGLKLQLEGRLSAPMQASGLYPTCASLNRRRARSRYA
jgi:hypothetical protein